MGKAPPFGKKKVADGDDKDAALDLVLDAPPGAVKDGEDAMGFAKRMKGEKKKDPEYASKGPERDESCQAIEDILEEHGVEDAHATAEDICQAIVDGQVPHVTADLPADDGGGDPPEDEDPFADGKDGNPFDDAGF